MTSARLWKISLGRGSFAGYLEDRLVFESLVDAGLDLAKFRNVLTDLGDVTFQLLASKGNGITRNPRGLSDMGFWGSTLIFSAAAKSLAVDHGCPAGDLLRCRFEVIPEADFFLFVPERTIDIVDIARSVYRTLPVDPPVPTFIEYLVTKALKGSLPALFLASAPGHAGYFLDRIVTDEFKKAWQSAGLKGADFQQLLPNENTRKDALDFLKRIEERMESLPKPVGPKPGAVKMPRSQPVWRITGLEGIEVSFPDDTALLPEWTRGVVPSFTRQRLIEGKVGVIRFTQQSFRAKVEDMVEWGGYAIFSERVLDMVVSLGGDPNDFWPCSLRTCPGRRFFLHLPTEAFDIVDPDTSAIYLSRVEGAPQVPLEISRLGTRSLPEHLPPCYRASVSGGESVYYETFVTQAFKEAWEREGLAGALFSDLN